MSRLRPAAAVAALLGILLISGLAAVPSAHEIPRGATVHAFVKAEGDRLRLLVRVPLVAMRDIQFPERADGSLDVARADPALRTAVAQWILPGLEIRQSGEPVTPPAIAAVQVSLPSDRSFGSYEEALAHITMQPRPEQPLPWNQALLDVLIEYPIRPSDADLTIRPGFERLAVDVVTVMRFVHLRQGSGGQVTEAVRAFEFRGDPGFVRLDPRWHHAAWQFVKLGFFHILDGVDHLLFLLCLVIPLRRLRPLILVVTAFTIAHSITLAGSAYGLAPDALWFPPLVETLIAASIVYMALENIVIGASKRRWLVAFGFGLVHGFGFSFALRETMQFAGSHLLTSLLFFNIGVEIGQVLVLIALVPLLQALFRAINERMGTIVLSALIAHTAWHWMGERWSVLRQFPVPALDAAALAMGARVLLIIVGIWAAIWIAARLRALREVRRDAPS